MPGGLPTMTHATLQPGEPEVAPVKRNAKGHFLPGHAPRSPGRPPGVSAVDRLSAMARELAKPLANAVSAVELARQCSPAVIARAVEIATTTRSETVALRAAEMVLDRALGKPVESVALAHADLNAPSAAWAR